MKSSFKMLAALCTAAAALASGCSSDKQGSSSDSGILLNEQSDEKNITPECVDESDATPAQSADCNITMSDSGAQISGSGAKAEGTTVTVTEAGVYSVTGGCSNGKIVIDAAKDAEVTLLLNGIELTSKSGPAIYCDNAGKFTLTLAQGTQNIISDTENYSFDEGADEPDTAVFSREDTVINGTGALEVNGNYLGAIKCKDGLKICGGEISVNSVDDAVKGKDYLIVAGGKLKVTSGRDGLVSTNTKDEALGYINITGGEISITAQNDGIQAQTELIIDGGSISVVSGGGSSTAVRTDSGSSRDGFFGGRGDDFSQWENSTGETTESIKGIKAGRAITINSGVITVDSADDSVHSNGDITITGGSFELSSGDDGIHADGSLRVSEGDILIKRCYEGLEGLTVEIEGGTINLTASDDGINAAGESTGGFGIADENCYISISGGSVTIDAGGDGIDSNGTIAMSGGVVMIFGPTDGGNGAIDYESSFALSGGTLAALGSAGMAAAPSTLSQPCLSIYSQVSAGSSLEVRNAQGDAIISVVTPKNCESLIFSSAEMAVGEEYGIFADDTLLASVVAENGVSGGGASGNGMGGFGGFGGFGRNDDKHQTPPSGEMPENFGGERPELPSGEMPENFGGDFAKPDDSSQSEQQTA